MWRGRPARVLPDGRDARPPSLCTDNYLQPGTHAIISVSRDAVHSMKPASVLLEPLSESESKAAPAPAFLVDLPPWHRIFLHNLSDLFRGSKDSSLHLYSRPGSFWPDVFVTSRLPWNRFAQSAICHVAFIVALWGSMQLWPQPPQVLDRPVFNRADVIYYAPSEYLPPLDTGGVHRPLPQKGEPEHAPQPIISVPAEADNRTQTIVTPSDIKLNHDVPMPNIVAWSQTPAQPAMPLASTTAAASLKVPEMPVTAVAPAPETMPANRQRAPAFSQTAVAPAPEVDAESSRTLRAPQAAVVEPPPLVDAATARRLGDISIGHTQVVAPAPELPMAEQYAVAARTQAGLGGGTAGASIVPPPPSVPGNADSSPDGRIIALGIHPTAMGPGMAMPAGNRRGTFAATPAGKAGAPGTPDIAAGTNPGSGSGSSKNRRGDSFRPDGRRGSRQPEPLGRRRTGKWNWGWHYNDPEFRQLPSDGGCLAAAGFVNSASFTAGSFQGQSDRRRSLDFWRQKVLRHDPEHAQSEFRGRKLGHSLRRAQSE